MKPVKCNFWRKVKKGEDCCRNCEGMCNAGVIKSPTIEFCNERCRGNTSKPNHLFVAGIDYSKKPNIFQRIKSYLTAEASMMISGQAKNRIYSKRIKACRSCEHIMDTYDDVGHCGKCGCGTGKRAGLTVKCKMPRATCPLGKWKI